MYSQEYKKSRYLEELPHELKKQKIQEIFNDPNYIILDLRSDLTFPDTEHPEMTFQFNPETLNIFKIQSSYVKLDYDTVREDPFNLIKSIIESKGPSEEDLDLINDLDRNNPINPIRDQKILILCGDKFCGCRMMFCTWYGFEDVTTLQYSYDFLPGGRHNAFELEDDTI